MNIFKGTGLVTRLSRENACENQVAGIKTTRLRESAASLLHNLLVSAAGLPRCDALRSALLSAPYVRARAHIYRSESLRRAGREARGVRGRLLIGLVAGFVLLASVPSGVLAECNPAPGTVINQANWQQYKECFSDGVQTFWSQSGFWKMPDDVEIHVGTSHQWVLPKPFMEATEKFGGRARLVQQSDGGYRLENYTAGVPFLAPNGPDKAIEILANATYRMTGYTTAGFPDAGAGPAQYYSKDGRGNWSAETLDYVYRQLAYNWEPEVPQNDPQGAGAWSSEWVMVESPEQMRYTALLTLHWQDNLRDEDEYAFVPALRRSLRLPAAAKCMSMLGGDIDAGDIGVGKYAGEFMREQPLLTLVEMNPQFAGKFPEEYDGALGWPKPSWGDWETRTVEVVEIHRISSLGVDRCYGKRTMYLDKQYYQTLAEDLYDRDMQLSKVVWVGLESGSLDHYGQQMGFGGAIEICWDVQKEHASYISSIGRDPKPFAWDWQVPRQYQNVALYSSPGGLAQLMR